jgi:hypothetical protein
MKFKIEQVAICPKDPAAAIELLTALGAEEWAHDHVVALGTVYGDQGGNEANLAFNYTMGNQDTVVVKPLEFEVLHYTTPDNWMNHDERRNSVSHLGMHCTEKELEEFKLFFFSRSIHIAQEVQTQSHTNPVIDGKRLYHYCIFDTKDILGVDLKFIVRQML